MKIILNKRLDEMAMERADAIDRCIALGKKFTAHFVKMVEGGFDKDDSYNHHCNEMQTWYDNIKSLKFKHNNKPITHINMIDWFFTCGSNVEDIVGSDLEDIYNEFVVKLISNDSVIDSFDVIRKLS